MNREITTIAAKASRARIVHSLWLDSIPIPTWASIFCKQEAQETLGAPLRGCQRSQASRYSVQGVACCAGIDPADLSLGAATKPRRAKENH